MGIKDIKQQSWSAKADSSEMQLSFVTRLRKNLVTDYEKNNTKL